MNTALQYKKYFRNPQFLFSALLSVILLFVSLVINFFAIASATDKASNSVTDIILNNIPVYDVQLAFIYGPLIMWIFVFCLLFLRPNQIPFTLNSISLFVLIRSVFINMTHLGPFPTEIPISPESFINYFASGGDLFFSAHTGLPVLLAFIFWKSDALKFFFIVCSIFFGAVVLMGHLHYTIDVLSAFFITYTIFRLSEIFFKKDKQMFDQESMVL